jgi:hypothetical protein
VLRPHRDLIFNLNTSPNWDFRWQDPSGGGNWISTLDSDDLATTASWHLKTGLAAVNMVDETSQMVGGSGNIVTLPSAMCCLRRRTQSRGRGFCQAEILCWRVRVLGLSEEFRCL